MNGSVRLVRWLKLWGVAWLILFISTGCKPEFTESECASDADCFADETCSAQGVCTVMSAGVMLPEVSSFEADPAEVEEGGATTLSWETANVTSGSIASSTGDFSYSIPEADLASGSTRVEGLTEDATFTLSVTAGTRRDTATVDVTVTPSQSPPTIESFTVMPENILEGDRIALEWTSTGATQGEIRDGEDSVPLDAADLDAGVYRVNISSTTTFTLSMRNEFGETTQDLLVEVTPANLPVITSFTVDSDAVASGEEVTFNWDVSGADSITITDEGAATIADSSDAMGSATATVDAAQTYTLTATNGAGSVTADVSVAIIDAPQIVSFTASQEMDVAPGASIDLSWDVTGADTIIITDAQDNTVTASMMATGTFSVTIDASTTFTLRASNAAGEDTAMVSVNLLGTPTINTFMASQAADVINGSTIDLSWDVTGADSITITDSASNVIGTSMDAAGSVSALVTRDETYTLTATNAAGDALQMLDVTVLRAATINNFTASQSTDIVPGSSIDLSWDVTGADSITITDSANNVLTTSMDATGTFAVTVNADETYSLTATNGSGDTSSATSVTVLRVPTINSFDASQNMDVAPGTSVNLSWVVNGADSIRIDDEGGTEVTTSTQSAGTFTVVITQNKTYTLTATNAAGASTSSPVQITILGSPTINSFTASQSTDIVPGSNVDLSWDVSDATSITITDSGGNTITTSTMATGTVMVTVNADEIYTLSATNATGTTQQDASVFVLDAPTINSFIASPDANVIINDSVDLSWDVTGADSITITDSGGNTVTTSTMATGTFAYTAAAQDETFTLTATNVVGNATATASFILRPTPTINTFVASQTSVAANAMVTLSWDVADADTIAITDSGGNTISSSTMATGMTSVTVAASETYTLTATNGNGSDTATVMITVVAGPTINSFTASPQDDIPAGNSTTLSWDVTDADSIAITDSGGNTITTSTMATGTVMATVSADETYTLTATNTGGDTTANVSVTILEAPVINSFTASKTTDVGQGTDVTFSWDVSNPVTSITITDSGSNTLHTTTNLTGTVDITVNADETYTLTATNAAGMATDSIMITTIALPQITTFTSDNTMTISGGKIIFSWTTTGADTLTLTDDHGDLNYMVPMGDVASGSTATFPQITSAYTLTATNAGGSVTAVVNITVDAAPLVITELFYDAAGGDADLEWVEIFNEGDTFVNLRHYSLGFGGGDYINATYQLGDIVLAPKGTVVIGGPTSNATNGMPVFAQTDSFDAEGGIQNSGAAADGFGLFFTPAASITNATAPIDNIVYGPANTDAFIDEAGAPEAVLAPDVPSGQSLGRASGAADLFIANTTPQPNLPVHVTSLDFTVGPNQATQSITIDGYGFEPDLDEIKLGATDLNCVAISIEQMLCDLVLPSTDTGIVDLTIKRVSEYTPDANNAPMISPLAPADHRTYTLPAAFTFEGQEADPGAEFYCALLDPAVSTAQANTPITLEVVLYAMGSTETANGDMLPAGWMVQFGYFERARNPFETLGINWVDFTSQRDDTINPNNEIFGAMVNSATPALVESAARVSRDGGANWIYCDLNSIAGGSDNGWDNAGGADLEWTP